MSKQVKEKKEKHYLNMSFVLKRYKEMHPGEKVTQGKIAEEIGISDQTFSDLSHQKYTPKFLQTLCKIIEVLECDFEDLLIKK